MLTFKEMNNELNVLKLNVLKLNVLKLNVLKLGPCFLKQFGINSFRRSWLILTACQPV